MSVHKLTAAVVIARQRHFYQKGDRVKVLRGTHGGKEFKVWQSANDWVMLEGLPSSKAVMSKGNVEPWQGFTAEELAQAAELATRGIG